MKSFEGVLTALVTPFDRGVVDFGSLKRLLHQQLDSGIEGFIVSGSTGEAATLAVGEREKILQFVQAEVAGQVPVVMGCGTFNTSETCELIKIFEKSKPDCFLVVSPYYNKPPQRGLIQHFKKVSESTSLPVILYNVPGRTSSKIEPETVAQIASACKNVVGIKEAAGDLQVIKKLTEICPKGFIISSGDDPTFLDAMALGAQGVISVVAHVIPKKCVEHSKKIKLLYKMKSGALTDQAAELSRDIRDISEKIFCESNPIPVKWALKEMGIISSAELRLPLVELAPEYHPILKKALRAAGAL